MFNDSDNSEAQSETAAAAADGKSTGTVRPSNLLLWTFLQQAKNVEAGNKLASDNIPQRGDTSGRFTTLTDPLQHSSSLQRSKMKSECCKSELAKCKAFASFKLSFCQR